MALTAKEKKLFKKHVTNPDGDTFVVTGLENIVGAAMARYSRSSEGLREILLNEFIKEGIFDEEHAEVLIGRILVGYGDDSVGEFRGAHVGMENVSNLLSKKIEDKRIGVSPIEKSTRYVFYTKKDASDNWKYLREKSIMASRYEKDFLETMDFVFQTYSDCVEPMMKLLGAMKPLPEAEYDILGRNDGTKQKLADLTEEKQQKAFRIAYKFDLQTKACDTLRNLLPACTLTNVGLYGNGRAFQNMITDLKTQDLDEMQSRGEALHQELSKIMAQYVKRAMRNEYADKVAGITRAEAEFLKHENLPGADIALFDDRGDFESALTASVLYPYSESNLQSLFLGIQKIPDDEKKRIINHIVGDRGKNRRNRVERGFEYGYPLTYDLLGDFGIYRDLQRQRMLTQQRQMLSTRLGFVIPGLIEEAGLSEKFQICAEKSADLYEKIRSVLGREIAQYVVLFGFKIRWYMGMNLREAQHFFELRTGPQGHPAYRKMCMEMARLAIEKFPFAERIFSEVDYNDYFWSRADSEARQRSKELKMGFTTDSICGMP